MASCVLKNVTKSADGRVIISWGDGTTMEFTDLASLSDWAKEADKLDNTQRVCVAYVLARSANLSNIATVQNKAFTFDLSLASPIRVQ